MLNNQRVNAVSWVWKISILQWTHWIKKSPPRRSPNEMLEVMAQAFRITTQARKRQLLRDSNVQKGPKTALKTYGDTWDWHRDWSNWNFSWPTDWKKDHFCGVFGIPEVIHHDFGERLRAWNHSWLKAGAGWWFLVALNHPIEDYVLESASG